MEVTVEIRVEPKSRADRTTVFSRNRSTTEDPARPAFLYRGLHQCISSEATPRFQLWSNTRFVRNHADQISRPASLQHGDQLRQKARRERLLLDIEIDISPHCALIQLSDPVTLTARSVIKIRTVFPSAVPLWSVEIRS